MAGKGGAAWSKAGDRSAGEADRGTAVAEEAQCTSSIPDTKKSNEKKRQRRSRGGTLAQVGETWLKAARSQKDQHGQRTH